MSFKSKLTKSITSCRTLSINRGGDCEIEFVFAESESEVEIGQFGREGQKQRSFGPKNTVFGVKMGQKFCFDHFWLQIRIHHQKLNKLTTRVEIFLQKQRRIVPKWPGRGVLTKGGGGKKVGGGYEIETVFTDSESEVEID